MLNLWEVGRLKVLGKEDLYNINMLKEQYSFYIWHLYLFILKTKHIVTRLSKGTLILGMSTC
jgi:hypothetical protein